MVTVRHYEHPAWMRLTNDQRQAINQVWNDVVLPALEEAVLARQDRDNALLAAQDARDALRLVQQNADHRAQRDRAKRQELHRRIVELENELLFEAVA